MAQANPQIYESAQDLVAILDSNSYLPLFASLHPMKVNVRESSRMTAFPVEDGSTRTDHRVVLPIEIELPILITDSVRDQFQQLRKAYLAGTAVIVQTKVGSYPSMVISECPHAESPEQGASVAVSVRLAEIEVITPQYDPLPPSKVAKPAQTDTVKRGEVKTSAPSGNTQRRASALFDAWKSL